MVRRLLPAALLLTFAAAPASAQADRTTIGSDLKADATIAASDPNDIAFWPGSGGADLGIEVPVRGEAIAFRLKGGTVQTKSERARAEAFDPDYDLMHFQVLHPQGDGTFQATSTSEDYVAPVIGVNASKDTVKEWLADTSRLCVEPGDRISLSEVGGYVPYIFGNGLRYQTFGQVGSATTNEFRAGGMIAEDRTALEPTPVRGRELLLQVVIGSGQDARWTCQTPAQRAATAEQSSGPKAPRVLPPMARPSLKTRRLDKRGRVPMTVRCRAAGTDCAGTIELRAHKRRIGRARYALVKGASSTFRVKLTRRGRRDVRRASAGKLRTAAVVRARGGRKASGLFHIKPRRARH